MYACLGGRALGCLCLSRRLKHGISEQKLKAGKHFPFGTDSALLGRVLFGLPAWFRSIKIDLLAWKRVQSIFVRFQCALENGFSSKQCGLSVKYT